jgi:hypothetical protein
MELWSDAEAAWNNPRGSARSLEYAWQGWEHALRLSGKCELKSVANL